MTTIRNRRRLQLLLVVLMFALPILVSGVMIAGGWMPGARSYGEPILPQRSFAEVPVTLADGMPYPWQEPDWRFTLVALPGPGCAEHCLQTLDLMHRARYSLNQKSSRVRLLLVGASPTGVDPEWLRAWQVGDAGAAFAAWTPVAPDAVGALLVRPDGTALTAYRAGFDPNGLRKDLAKVTK